MKRSGKQGKLNQKANKALKKTFEEAEIVYCELCGTHSWLSFAHRHKRRWYRGRSELLSDFNQVMLLCMGCHMKLESDKNLTEETFLKYRGEEC